MKKKSVIIFAIFISFVLCVAFSISEPDKIMKSDGAPPYNTNAPGEKTCSGPEGANACHSSVNADNSGPGIPSIIFNNGFNTYVPGQTYIIKPKITHPTRNRFGFQIVSLRDSDSTFIGTVTLLDTLRTSIHLPTTSLYQDRQYVEQRFDGSYPTTSNTGEWTYSWKAPATDQGTITFYACFLVANNNNTNDGGDQVYYTKLAISPGFAGVNEIKENNTLATIYPNPASNFVNINISKNENFKVKVFNVKGEIVFEDLITESITKINTIQWQNGMYYFKIFDSKNSQTSKILINK